MLYYGVTESSFSNLVHNVGILQRDRPTTAITVKTRESMAAVLHAMKESTKELKDGGLLDNEEFKLLSKAIEERQKLMRKRYLTISPCQPDTLLRQVSWLLDNEETANFLIVRPFFCSTGFASHPIHACTTSIHEEYNSNILEIL